MVRRLGPGAGPGQDQRGGLWCVPAPSSPHSGDQLQPQTSKSLAPLTQMVSGKRLPCPQHQAPLEQVACAVLLRRSLLRQQQLSQGRPTPHLLLLPSGLSPASHTVPCPHLLTGSLQEGVSSSGRAPQSAANSSGRVWRSQTCKVAPRALTHPSQQALH